MCWVVVMSCREKGAQTRNVPFLCSCFVDRMRIIIPVALFHESKIESNLNLNDSGEGNTTKLLHEEVSKVRWLARERRSRARARRSSAGLGPAVKEKKQWAGLVAGTLRGRPGPPVASPTRV
jgi:hypothetical protein